MVRPGGRFSLHPILALQTHPKGLQFVPRCHSETFHLPPRRGCLGFVLLLPTPPEPRPTRQPVPACPAPYAWLGAPQSSVCAWRICCMVGCLPFTAPQSHCTEVSVRHQS